MPADFLASFVRIEHLTQRKLFRALVLVPGEITSGDCSFEERTVFFEADIHQEPGNALATLLQHAWGINSCNWNAHSWISQIISCAELRLMTSSLDKGLELHVLEWSRGGRTPDAIGPHGIYYARASEIDLFVTPKVAARLAELIAEVEHMAEAEPARRVRPRPYLT